MADRSDGEAERNLRKQLETAQAIAHMGSWQWDLATGTVTWSDELYRIYGLGPQSQPITLEFFLSCIHPDERDRIQREIENALQQRGRFAYRELIVRPSGDIRTLDTIGEVITDGEGNVTTLIGTCRDVTDEARRDQQLQFFADVFASAQVGLSAWQIDRRGDSPKLRMVAFNRVTEDLAGGSLAGRLGQLLVDVFPGVDPEFLRTAREMCDGSTTLRKISPFRFDSSPRAPIVAATLFALPGRHIGLALEDVTEQRSAQILQSSERRALEMLTEGQPVAAILGVAVTAVEEVLVGALGSILLLDETGTSLCHGVAPRLPHAYNLAIDHGAIGPRAGSCGTAMYRREPVYVDDIETDPLWDDYRELARTHGLRSCWSSPILANDGRVLGTFAIYHRTPCRADDGARELLKRASHVVAIVLGRRELDEQLRALAGRIEAAREDERTAIARDIHDQLGQAMTALKLDLGWLTRRITDDALDRKLEEMTRATDEIIRTVQRISADLRPGMLDEIGLHAAIEWQAEQFAQRAGTPCRVHSNIGDLRLERELATTVFRIFQEAITNVARHANAHAVDVELVLDHGQLRLDVADDGIGLPDVGSRASLGILGMSERARRLGGDCTVKRRSPRGTVVTATMPLRFPSEQVDSAANASRS